MLRIPPLCIVCYVFSQCIICAVYSLHCVLAVVYSLSAFYVYSQEYEDYSFVSVVYSQCILCLVYSPGVFSLCILRSTRTTVLRSFASPRPSPSVSPRRCSSAPRPPAHTPPRGPQGAPASTRYTSRSTDTPSVSRLLAAVLVQTCWNGRPWRDYSPALV